MPRPSDNTRFEAYKLAVEMADRVSARRGQANTFFLTVNTTLVAVFTYVGFKPTNQASNFNNTIFIGLVGVTICCAWYFAIRSYRRLNGAKYSVILKMEDQLGVAPFGDEWSILKKQAPDTDELLSGWRRRWIKLRDQYTDLTNIESAIPVVFIIIYIGLIIRSLF